VVVQSRLALVCRVREIPVRDEDDSFGVVLEDVGDCGVADVPEASDDAVEREHEVDGPPDDFIHSPQASVVQFLGLRGTMALYSVDVEDVGVRHVREDGSWECGGDAGEEEVLDVADVGREADLGVGPTLDNDENAKVHDEDEADHAEVRESLELFGEGEGQHEDGLRVRLGSGVYG
jgi:hypothetical protein